MVIFAVLGAVGAAVALIALAAILNGYALSVLWSWFMVPTFHLPPLGIVPAMGMAMVVSFLTYHYDEDKAKEQASQSERIGKVCMSIILRPVMALILGWVIHQFM